MSEFNYKHLESVLRHIELVQSATQLLGKRLIESGEPEFGLSLMANGLRHDQSKLKGIEWDFLVVTAGEDETPEEKAKREELLTIAWRQHVETNEHHPEYWGSINEMPRIFVAEMVCDWYARSQEQATGLRAHIKEKAAKRFGMSLNGKTYKQVKGFVDMLLDPEFTPIKKDAGKPEEKEA